MPNKYATILVGDTSYSISQETFEEVMRKMNTPGTIEFKDISGNFHKVQMHEIGSIRLGS